MIVLASPPWIFYPWPIADGTAGHPIETMPRIMRSRASNMTSKIDRVQS